MSPSVRISVVIPVYNGERTIGAALKAVLAQDVREPFEVIVVDDGSSDGTGPVAQSFPSVKYVRQDNAGPAAARNRGADAAGGEIIFFTDSDCVPHANWLRTMLPFFDRPDVGAVAGSYGIANPHAPLARGIHQEILFRHNRMPDEIQVFGSYNVAVRRDVFRRAGGFDAGFRRASGEDNDLSYKILALGARIVFARHSLVDHHHTERVGKYLREQFRHGYWRVRMYVRHPRMMRGDQYTFWKDALEVPAAAAVAAGVLGFLPPLAWVGVLGAVSLAALLVVEMYFGVMIMRSWSAGLFWGSVMTLRAFYRTAGFLWGGLSCLVPARQP